MTPITNMGVSSLEGAVSNTFLAPPARCPFIFSAVVNLPVLSMMYSAPTEDQGISWGFLAVEHADPAAVYNQIVPVPAHLALVAAMHTVVLQ